MSISKQGGLIVDDLKENFIIEATELLDEAEEALLDYDNGLEFKACYNKVFRAFHSLKGASGMFGILKLQEHLHQLETLLSGVEESFPEGSIDYFLRGVDTSRKFFENDNITFEYVESFESPKVLKTTNNSSSVTTVNIRRTKDKNKDKDNGYVYVVDDEPTIVELLEEVLVSRGIRVRTFFDGQEVLEAITDDEPDLILSDIKMPKVDGLLMLKQIEKIGFQIPIVFISGYVTKDAVVAGLNSGAHYFLEKPFDDKVVLTLTDSILKNVHAKKVLEKSIDYVMYQFANQEKLLIQAGRDKEVKLIKEEVKGLVELTQKLFP